VFAHIKFAALAVGQLIFVVTAVIAFFVGSAVLSWAMSTESRTVAIVCVLGIFSFRMIGFLATGYCAAKIAGTQPLLHGAISGLIGTAFAVVLGSPILLALLVVLPTVITGAWLYKRRRDSRIDVQSERG